MIVRNQGSIGARDLHLENFSVSNGGKDLIEVNPMLGSSFRRSSQPASHSLDPGMYSLKGHDCERLHFLSIHLRKKPVHRFVSWNPALGRWLRRWVSVLLNGSRTLPNNLPTATHVPNKPLQLMNMISLPALQEIAPDQIPWHMWEHNQESKACLSPLACVSTSFDLGMSPPMTTRKHRCPVNGASFC